MLRLRFFQFDVEQVQNTKLNEYKMNLVKIGLKIAYYRKLAGMTQEELAVYRRGRNAKSYTKAKNASMIDYRNATGFEALLGYLYLKQDFKRLTDVVKMGLDILEANQE